MTLKEATVTNVQNDNGIIVLQVEFQDGTARQAAFGKLSTNFILAPQEGDVVTVQKTDGNRYVATNVISKSETGAAAVGAGEAAFQLDENNLVRIKKENNGFRFILDLTDEIQMEADGNVTITSQGNIELNANGDIILGENGEPVARQNHTHDYDDTGDTEDGSAGTTTKTTTTPNEEGSTLEVP